MSTTRQRTLFAAAQAAGIQRLAWLQGCWQIDTPEQVVEEQWSAPRAASILGSSRTVRGEQLAYEVQPSGQAVTVFLSVRLDENSVVFENLQNDFPQRVAYERKGLQLMAWNEGPRRGQPGQMRRIAYPYRRVACASD